MNNENMHTHTQKTAVTVIPDHRNHRILLLSIVGTFFCHKPAAKNVFFFFSDLLFIVYPIIQFPMLLVCNKFYLSFFSFQCNGKQNDWIVTGDTFRITKNKETKQYLVENEVFISNARRRNRFDIILKIGTNKGFAFGSR